MLRDITCVTRRSVVSPPLPGAAPPPLPTPGKPPVVLEPTVSKEPPKGKLFPCLNCGAKVEFDPRERALKCPYCGHTSKVEDAGGEVAERSFNEYARKLVKARAMSRAEIDAMDASIKAAVDKAGDFALASPPRPGNAALEHVFA